MGSVTNMLGDGERDVTQASPNQSGMARETRRIGLVACCGQKAEAATAAKDLYRSDLFAKSRAYVERCCDGWAILSAKHGLVLPDEVIAPYNYTLDGQPAQVIRHWGDRVRQQLVSRFPGNRFLVLAGKRYRTAVDGLPHVLPMEGLGIGQQLQWLGRRIEGPRYYGVVTKREYIKYRGERKPFWEFLDEEPCGWLTSLAYAHVKLPGGPRMVDCGAWSYRQEETPRLGRDLVTPKWALAQYAAIARPRDMVIAPDHMLIPGLGDLNARRSFNLSSAAEFIKLAADTPFRATAVVHGTTMQERVDGACRYVDLGYRVLSLGGLAGQASRKTMAVEAVQAVREATPGVWLHVLGLSSPDYAQQWRRIGVQSFDGSSHFKQAFTGGAYYMQEGGRLVKYQAARTGEEITAPICKCRACCLLRGEGIDTRTYGSNENNMGRAAHNLNALMRAQVESDEEGGRQSLQMRLFAEEG